ncbi:pimeloyl-ACP methyl ester carboxylesterase [Arthrobacter sp. V4I6]|uniref:alpha/beta fold hydrolase n=1 Tax=unclassified Arthrobacter TaxID=235627 RepID=UPI002781190E|nr:MULTISPECIES: alpha/beta hydrolase [unclassified Arthrobacter]MDQ0819342.1 pimeloyl-ACP methyl ester carboxylesterase [Arthrobacter sp. V1I7]MDQ0853526.1 pimeloyl-ACP methyl ester carboxylesterase [Arthrobacter sp. V4I6]
MTLFPAGQDMTATTPTSPTSKGPARPPGPDPSQKGHLGWLVAGSLVTGVLAAILLAGAPIVPATESGVTGAILLGLALGWALVAVLSVRFTDQPQRWALAPALFMGLGGFLLVAFGSPMQEALTWVWPAALLVLVVWMVVRAHRQLHSRSGRVLLYPVIAMLVLSSLGAGFETLRGAADAAASPVQGQLIDVGGHRLYLNCTGSGSPTVVLEPGAGLMSSDLGWIAPAVAPDTRVCVYDRAGHGWSDPANTVQDGAQIATDLHTLLQRGNVPGPYVLAGHSFGGLYALAFAASYPEDLAGLVLVDSTAPAAHPESAQLTDTDSDDTASRVSALVAGASRLGVGRLLGVTPGDLRSTIDEYIQAGSSSQQAAALRSSSDKPLVVLTAGSGSQPGWDDSQEALAALSTNSLHRVIDGATHASLITNQEDAAATARGILDVVSAVRAASPLIP